MWFDVLVSCMSAIDEFLNKKKKDKDITPEWEDNLRKALTQFVSHSKKNPEQWTQKDVDAIFSSIRACDYKQNYRRTLIGHGKAFCKFLAKTNKNVDVAEINSIKTPPVQWKTKKPSDMLSPEEVEAAIKAARNARDRAFIAMLFDSSCRPVEILNLTWNELTSDKYGYAFVTDKKTGKERHIRLTSVSLPYLEQLRMEHPNPTGDTPVFVCKKAGSVKGFTMKNVQRFMADIRKRTGNKKIKPSIFRPSRITLDVKAHGDKLPYIMKKNWGSLKTKMIDVYTNLEEDYMDETALRMAGVERKSAEKAVAPKVEMPKCSHCGSVNPFGAKFCRVCNKSMESGEEPAVVELRAQVASLNEMVSGLMKVIVDGNTAKLKESIELIQAAAIVR